MIDIPLYSGDELERDLQPSNPLIKGVLWEGDFMMLLGSEKAGKSILAMQIALNLTTGNPFLDKYQVTKPVPVLYIQTEGKRTQFIERMKRMADTLDVDRLLLSHVPKKFLPFDVDEYFSGIIQAIDSHSVKPKVIIIDALYMAMAGSLSDNVDSRKFISKVNFLMDRYNTAIIVVHHDSREIRNKDQEMIERGDTGSYGSVFFRAIVDHILYLRMQRDKTRTLTCDTQRSGNVMTREDLILIEPSPLCFEIKGDYTAHEELIRHHIESTNSDGITRDELVEVTQASFSSVDKAIRHLYRDHIIKKTASRPVRFQPVNRPNSG